MTQASDHLAELMGTVASASAPEDDRMEAAHVLGLLGDRRATTALIAALPSAASIALRSIICRALGRLGDGRAVQALIDQIPHSTFWAIEALANLARKEAIPALHAALEDPKLRRIAVVALGRVGSPGIVHGRVRWFNHARGFGFVQEHGKDSELFFHKYDWDGDVLPESGAHVAYYPVTGARKPCAVRVRPVAAREPGAVDVSTAQPATGTVRWFDKERGWGFIAIDPDGGDALAHYVDITGDGFKKLRARQKVRCKLVKTAGGLRAVEIEVVGGG